VLVFTNASQSETRDDISTLTPGQTSATPFANTRFSERGPQFSRNGRWIAYISDESGRDEVYVRPYPGPGGKWQVSTEGGAEPVWAVNGRELFYRTGEQMMVVPVTTEPHFSADAPRVLFTGRFDRPAISFSNFDVSQDGQRFLMFKSARQSAPTQVTVVLDWTSELTRLVPMKP
jgi:eukaryotic-like serine/threonine-protein kinase